MTLLFDTNSNNEDLVIALFEYIEGLNDWVSGLAKALSSNWGDFIELNKKHTKEIFDVGADDLPNVFKKLIDELGMD